MPQWLWLCVGNNNPKQFKEWNIKFLKKTVQEVHSPLTKRNTQTGTVLISLEMSDLYLYFCSLTKGGIWREVWEKHQENAAFEDDKNCLIFLIMAGNFCDERSYMYIHEESVWENRYLKQYLSLLLRQGNFNYEIFVMKIIYTKNPFEWIGT